MNDWHGPYRGFQHVDLVIGHVDPLAGHYKHDLRAEYPEGIELTKRSHALDPAPGTASTWKNALPPEHHYNSWIARKTRDYLRQHTTKPFFLTVSFPDPHFPFSAPAPYCDMYNPADVPAPLAREGERDTQPPHFRDFIDLYAAGQTERDFRLMAAQTYGMIHFVDECIGTILEELDTLGLRRNTIVVFTSDHGELLGDHGLIYKGPYLYEPLVRTPLIVSAPGASRPPASTDALVGHVDLFPTLADLLGFPVPGLVQGVSCANVLSGTRSEIRDSVLTEFHDEYRQQGMMTPFNVKCIHHDRWKLVHYGHRSYGELYDLAEDPEEFHNLHSDAGYRNTVRELEALLTDELIRTEGEWPSRISPS